MQTTTSPATASPTVIANAPPLPIQLMILISLVQGLLLLLLHQSLELNFWPEKSPHWLFSFYAMAFAGPLMLLLGLRSDQTRQWFLWIIPFTLLIGLSGFYVGYQATPIEHVRYESLLFALIASLALAVFKAQMYIQQKIEGGKFTYANLFRWSWRNFLTVSLAVLFAGAFWGVLMLWAGLFKTIEINLFYDLFTERWFYYPVIALAFGFGVIIFRRLSHVIDVITRLQQALMKYLLVILIFVSIIFLGSLAVTGLQSLWDKGGSTLILWMQALILFFVNAVYQDDSEQRPYHPLIHTFIYCGVFLLPVYSLISFYGLTLRIEQYGWSIARCWAILVWFFLAAFSFGYAWGIARNRGAWLKPLSSINVVVGLMFLAVMVLVNSPLLDFRKVTLKSQLTQLKQGKVTLAELDLYYFRNDLARPGYEALQDLIKQYSDTNPEFVSRVNNLYSGSTKDERLETKEQFVASLVVKAKDPLPDELLNIIYNASQNAYRRDVKMRYIAEMDLNKDHVLEYLFVENSDHWPDMKLYVYEKNRWVPYEVENKAGYDQNVGREIAETLRKNDPEVVEPKWQDIKIGDVLLHVR